MFDLKTWTGPLPGIRPGRQGWKTGLLTTGAYETCTSQRPYSCCDPSTELGSIEFKSLWGIFTCLWSSQNLILMPLTEMRPSGRILEITILSFTIPLPGLLHQWNALGHTDRKKWFVVYNHDRFTVFFLYYEHLRAGGHFSSAYFNTLFMAEPALWK